MLVVDSAVLGFLILVVAPDVLVELLGKVFHDFIWRATLIRKVKIIDYFGHIVAILLVELFHVSHESLFCEGLGLVFEYVMHFGDRLLHR